MRPEFHFTRRDFLADFEIVCGTADDARTLLKEFPALCGVPLHRQDDTLFCTLDLDRLEEAILLIEGAGYSTVDRNARDEDYAIQEYEAGLPPLED